MFVHVDTAFNFKVAICWNENNSQQYCKMVLTIGSSVVRKCLYFSNIEKTWLMFLKKRHSFRYLPLSKHLHAHKERHPIK